MTSFSERLEVLCCFSRRAVLLSYGFKSMSSDSSSSDSSFHSETTILKKKIKKIVLCRNQGHYNAKDRRQVEVTSIA